MTNAGIWEPVSTYSIVARDAATGQLGVAVQSRYFAVGTLVPWAEAGVGAVATQASGNPDYGAVGLTLMRSGLSASQALAALVANDDAEDHRQVAMVDATGAVAAHTGAVCLPFAGHALGAGYSVQGNLLASPEVWRAMGRAYVETTGAFADRLVAALEAAEAAGGDVRGRESAAILIVGPDRIDRPWRGWLYDLRVDNHPEPILELRRLVRMQQAREAANAAARALMEDRTEAARDLIDQARSLADDISEPYYWGALELFRAGKEPAALELFRLAFARAPKLVETLPNLVAGGYLADDAASVRIRAAADR